MSDDITLDMLRANLDAANQANTELHGEVATLRLRLDSQGELLRKAALASVKSTDALEEAGVTLTAITDALEAANANSVETLHQRIPFGCISFSSVTPNITVSIMNPKTKNWASGQGNTVAEALQQVGKQ